MAGSFTLGGHHGADRSSLPGLPAVSAARFLCALECPLCAVWIVRQPDVTLSRVIRLAGRILPRAILRLPIPFNIGEFYVIARKPARPR
jgi:hypothetical protein